MDGKFLQMTENHLAMSGSVPRVPEYILAGPSGTDTIDLVLHRRDKSPVG